ncbi:MAG TPA: hypothetical protein VGD99_01200 [Anaerolineae bacterium]|jgi:hypothetical protein
MKHLVMDTTISQTQGEAPVSILQPHGNLDRFTYLDLIDKSRAVHDSGQPFLILDLSDITDVGLAGLYALYSIALLFQGREPLDPEEGWAAMRSMANHLDDMPYAIRLLRPQPHLRGALSTTGLPIYDDLAGAIASLLAQTPSLC